MAQGRLSIWGVMVNIDEMIAVTSQMLFDLSTLRQEYRWLHSAAYGPSSRPLGGGASGGHISRPTEGAALTRDQFKGRLRVVDRRMRALAKELSKLTVQATITYKPGDLVELSDSGPRSLGRAEYDRLVAAKTRRQKRGEDFGEG